MLVDPHGQKADSTGQRKILVVDDLLDIQLMIQIFLEQSGFAVATADNGFDALLTLQQEPLPDLIVLDLVMPVMGGREFRRLQLQESAWRDIPVILFSSDADARKAAKEMKCAGFAAKSHGDLLGEIFRILSPERVTGAVYPFEKQVPSRPRGEPALSP